jgi:hypothetical protein
MLPGGGSLPITTGIGNPVEGLSTLASSSPTRLRAALSLATEITALSLSVNGWPPATVNDVGAGTKRCDGAGSGTPGTIGAGPAAGRPVLQEANIQQANTTRELICWARGALEVSVGMGRSYPLEASAEPDARRCDPCTR